jgi:hypothetical protein
MNQTGIAGEIVIAKRFMGPPGSANGGYAAGRAAVFVEGDAEVTLRARPPLERPLHVERRSDGLVAVIDGDQVVLEARPAELEVPPPPHITFEEAAALSRPWPDHDFPDCFVCGPNRLPGDGLRIWPQQAPGANILAAAWVPGVDLAGPEGTVRPEFYWAALDCPSGFAAHLLNDQGEVIILGRLTVHLQSPLTAGDRCVLVAWPVERDGRKIFSASALSRDGEMIAVARATWLTIPRDAEV